MDLKEMFQKDKNKLSCLLQNNIDGYGGSLNLSNVQALAARE